MFCLEKKRRRSDCVGCSDDILHHDDDDESNCFVNLCNNASLDGWISNAILPLMLKDSNSNNTTNLSSHMKAFELVSGNNKKLRKKCVYRESRIWR